MVKLKKKCKQCGKTRELRFFATPRSRICETCKKANKRAKKKTSISTLKKKLEKLVKEYIRNRDKYTCQHCGIKVRGSNCHVSHVIPRSAGNALRFDPMNLKILCYHCHINWWHKNPLESAEWFTKKFPKRYKYLQEHKNDKVDWKSEDYQLMIKEHELLIKILEK
ncbi:MAG: hypothetical protein DRP97_00475 [Candidatus Latescibacterota bacterium]|nr:MAG: hypothetical protein DRP97_00475 [Candidatus Latescibacterota bacterium]